MYNIIEHDVVLIFLLQLIQIPFSIIEQKYNLLILNFIEVSLIIVHLITIKLDCFIFHSKVVLMLFLLATLLSMFGYTDFWIIIYVYNLKKDILILNQFALISMLIFCISHFNSVHQKSYEQTIVELVLLFLFDVYLQYKNYKIAHNPNSNEFQRRFNINHQEIKRKCQKSNISDVNRQNKERNTLSINQSTQNEFHYQIYQAQDSIPSLKDIFYPEWKKTYFCYSTEELLQVYDKENQNLFYILYITTEKNYKEIYRVQITRNKIQDYILNFTRLDSLLYFKLKGSKRRFRQHLSQIFSHKLKTPLNQALAKITSMLTDLNVLPYQKLILSQIYIQQKCQLYGILDFLDYVNLDSLTFQPQRVTLNQIIQNARDLIREQCKAKQIQLRILIENVQYKDYKGIVFLYTDSLKLERILYNLLNNAYRHSNQNGIIYLTVELFQGTVNFAIKDSGIGMTREMMADYNLQFQYHLNPSHSIKRCWIYKLGTTLFVTNKLIHLLNGNKGYLEINKQIENEFRFSILQELNINKGISEIGFGSLSSDRSEINVLINQQDHVDEIQEENEQIEIEPKRQEIKIEQLKHVKNVKQTITQQPSLQVQSKHSQMYNKRSSSIFDVNSFLRQFSFKDPGVDSNQELIVDKDQQIMIVDDEPFNHDALIMMLKRIGYTNFIHAYNGRECINKIQENHLKIKFILMDLDMPILNGFKATSILIDLMKSNQIKKIPIIACTAHDDYETETQCKTLGMLDIIIKPVFIKQLQTVIKNIPKTF
ncbi:unnamed protein product [Paramecium sonneborni]|uniref:Response regulatory domain-containing protein n=1 Tax=Paramecium sonneborni TaxID=65129 RepID=A0A8S1QWV3_9CILI|nr:unnamed protein product [Paramecium sonneborni]